MASQQEKISDLVRFLVTSLVDNPDDVNLEVQEEGNNLNVLVTAHQDDIGKIIGKSGRTIKSIRTLARAAASNSPIIVEVDVEG